MGVPSSWILKAMVQNVFSLLPNGHRLYSQLLDYVLRLQPKYHDRLHMRPEEFEQKLAVAQRHIEHYLEARTQYQNQREIQKESIGEEKSSSLVPGGIQWCLFLCI